MNTNVAVLGLGIMGSAIARSAIKAGLNTTGWDRSAERRSAVAADGLPVAMTPRQAVENADVVVTMVSDADAVISIMKEQEGLAAMKAGGVWIQMSTIGVEGTERASSLAATRPEIVFLDAPVSGSKQAAEQAKLVILASGDRTRSGEKVEKFFDAVGAKTHWLGDVGQGTRMKLMFNAWMGMLNEAVAEVAVLGDGLGIPLERFISLVTGGPLVPAWAIAKLKKISEKRLTETEFPLRWAHKDVVLALAAAGDESSRLPILNKISDTWADAERLYGADDLSAVYLALHDGGKR